MMKWKVVKNPRSASAERSLECLKNDVQLQLNNINNNINNKSGNDNNNNEETKQDNNNNNNNGSSTPAKDTNRQRDSSLARKAALDCIPLKSLLGHLTRQRSETDLSGLGLVSTEPRRSRSEVRGGCDRLTVGYHHSSSKTTRSSSPNGWLLIRGRRRERDSRTVVAGSGRTRNGDCSSRTIVDGSDGPRSKGGKNGKKKDVIEEEIYSEIRNNECGKKRSEENVSRPNNRVVRKKGMAPKPQIAKTLFDGDAGARKTSGDSPASLNEGAPASRNQQPVRKANHHQTYNGRNHREQPPVKLNNLVRAKNNINQARSVLAVVEVHKVDSPGDPKNTNSKTDHERNDGKPQSLDGRNDKNNKTDCGTQQTKDSVDKDSEAKNQPENVPASSIGHSENVLDVSADELMPFHIDTPDYSTLDSVTGNNNSFSLSTEDLTLSSRDDTGHCNNTDCDESLARRETSSLSSILRTDGENKESEPKKTVRFETLDLVDKRKQKTEETSQDLAERFVKQLTEGLTNEDGNPEETSDFTQDLIEKYKRNKTEARTVEKEDGSADTCASNFAKDLIERYTRQKTEGLAQTEDDSCPVPPEDTSSGRSEHILDVNSNEIGSEEGGKKDQQHRGECVNGMTVNVLVRNCAPASPQESEGASQFVVKKSFVLTVAKQEKGFRSLCEHKKPDPEPPKPDQISVTFLCSGPPSEGWGLPPRPRSTSVPPPRSLPPVEVIPLPAVRGRSRERRSKERQHCRKSHRARKKDAVFVMPQAVIDELSQVLEKRKPSLDDLHKHP